MRSQFEHLVKAVQSAAHSAACRAVLGIGVALAVLAAAACGGGGGNNTPTPPPPVSNTAPLAVNLGPANNFVNGLFVSVTVCNPGTTTCQTIPNVAVDTGSEGLRILSSQLTLSGLPAETDSSNNPLQECIEFGDGSYVWGPVVTADVQIAGEKAAGVPLQVVSASPAFATPANCASGGGANDNTVTALGANALLGIGNFQQDCGGACVPGSTSVPPIYYLCPNSVCSVATVPLTAQLQNPVWLFAQDNNGVLVSLPNIPAGGQAAVSGSLIFGIGTQSDNALGSAQVYTTDPNTGDFVTTYNGVQYNQSFIDSGSNGLYFLNAATAAITSCSASGYSGYYCPASTASFMVTNTGINGTTGPTSFMIGNAEQLLPSGSAAFNDLGGGSAGGTQYFDFGLPFFYGRNVFVGIEGLTSPGGTGPYWAY